MRSAAAALRLDMIRPHNEPRATFTMESDPHDFLTYECGVHVDAPPERVFTIVGDLSSSSRWAGSGHVRSIRQVTDGPVGVGTRYLSDEKITVGFRAWSEILVYEPGELIVWKSKPWGERVPWHRWSFQLTPENGGTRLTHAVRAARAFGVAGWVQRLGFLFTHPVESIPPGMERTLANVKALAEKSG